MKCVRFVKVFFLFKVLKSFRVKILTKIFSLYNNKRLGMMLKEKWNQPFNLTNTNEHLSWTWRKANSVLLRSMRRNIWNKWRLDILLHFYCFNFIYSRDKSFGNNCFFLQCTWYFSCLVGVPICLPIPNYLWNDHVPICNKIGTIFILFLNYKI